MVLRHAGPDYCLAHAGIREEDEERCDFADPCGGCAGDGYVARPGDDEGAICGTCQGSGLEPCKFTSLLYEDGKN